MVGKTIAHYKVLAKLGEGGMGIVYTAEDTRLQRTVALKFLPHQISGDQNEQERLLHEARAAATLNHPNICTIYAIEEAEGERFIVMEYVKGMHLREKVQSGKMSTQEALDYGIHTAEALQEAHSQGVVHRDIKTENIMVNERGQVKVMDFGLAKLKGALRLTKSRSTVGTLAYMSPEQIDGRDVDARSDIFSLGVVLYELLSGKYPFRGEHEAAMVYSIMNEEPEPVQKHMPEASSELIHIFNRALEKNPEERYQTVHEMLIDMRRLKKDTGPVSRNSVTSRPTRPEPVGRPKLHHPRWRLPMFAAFGIIAVVAAVLILFLPSGERELTDASTGRKTVMILPFVNRGAPEDAYFAAGLTDEIQNRLTPVYGIALISRITADQYGESPKTTQQMREETGADYLLRGSVQWSRSGEGNGRVKVTTQLVRTTDDRQIWSESYERGMAGVFEVQGEIAGAVIKELDMAIAERERDLMMRNPTRNPEAYQLFLRGMEKFRESLYRGSPLSGVDSAAAFHHQATLLDTSFAQAYAGMAFVHSWAYHIGDRTPERLDATRHAMERALELDPDDPRTRITHAWYQYRMFRDYERALEECEAAQKALPNAVM
ncbi:MAG: serine/threonine-protein kinase, partial [Bacteroidota bacterium]